MAITSPAFLGFERFFAFESSAVRDSFMLRLAESQLQSLTSNTSCEDSAKCGQCGVGVFLRQAQEGIIEVASIKSGCSAEDILIEGDIISAVDGTTCAGLSLRDISHLIIGEEDSCVTITVIRQMPTSPSSGKTFMKEVPVILTRQPFPKFRQFIVSNTGSLPLKLFVYDRDDVLRVCEVVAPFLQYPVELNTCVHAFLPTVSFDSRFITRTRAGICRCRATRTCAW
jgi:hypothetical protein